MIERYLGAELQEAVLISCSITILCRKLCRNYTWTNSSGRIADVYFRNISFQSGTDLASSIRGIHLPRAEFMDTPEHSSRFGDVKVYSSVGAGSSNLWMYFVRSKDLGTYLSNLTLTDPKGVLEIYGVYPASHIHQDHNHNHLPRCLALEVLPTTASTNEVLRTLQ